MNELVEKIKGKVLIATVGNPLRGDDGIGSLIYENLKGKIKATLLNCEESPEKFLDTIVNENPDTVIFIDSVISGSKAGTIFLINEQELLNFTTSTHRLPLMLSIKYIKSQIPCEALIIGIESKKTEFGARISEEVLASAKAIVDFLIKNLSQDITKA